MKKGVVEVETTDYLAPCSSVRTISLLPHQSTNYINFLVYIFIYLLVSSYCFVYGMHIWWIHFYHMFASSIAMVTAAQNRHSSSSSSSSNDNNINKWTTEIVLVMLQSWLNYNNIMDMLCPGIKKFSYSKLHSNKTCIKERNLDNRLITITESNNLLMITRRHWIRPLSANKQQTCSRDSLHTHR